MASTSCDSEHLVTHVNWKAIKMGRVEQTGMPSPPQRCGTSCFKPLWAEEGVESAHILTVTTEPVLGSGFFLLPQFCDTT